MKYATAFISIAFVYIALFDTLITSGIIEQSIDNVFLINECFNFLCALMAIVGVRIYKLGSVAFLSAFSMLFLFGWNLLSIFDYIPKLLYMDNIRLICNYGMILILVILTIKKVRNSA